MRQDFAKPKWSAYASILKSFVACKSKITSTVLNADILYINAIRYKHSVLLNMINLLCIYIKGTLL